MPLRGHVGPATASVKPAPALRSPKYPEAVENLDLTLGPYEEFPDPSGQAACSITSALCTKTQTRPRPSCAGGELSLSIASRVVLSISDGIPRAFD